MAHECIKCGTRVKSSEDIVNGCPSCGHKLFKFINDRPVKDRVKKLKLSEDESKEKSNPNSNPKINDSITKDSKTKKDGKLGSTDLGLESFSDEVNKSIETITVEEQGIYELNLQNLLEGDEGVVGDKRGNYAVDINSLFKKGKKEQDK
ncbi:MAG: Zn-ribbon domain-containing protein [Methanobacteriaceae archaeon]